MKRLSVSIVLLVSTVSYGALDLEVKTLPASVAKNLKCMNSKYLVYTPKGAKSSRKQPLLIFLHGVGCRGKDLEKLKDKNPAVFLEKMDYPFTVVVPQCALNKQGKGWWNTGDLQKFLDHVVATENVDVNRIYLTGYSMGGFGVWAWAVKQPNRFAAIAPLAGGGKPGEAKKIAEKPIWVFHGKKDRTVKFEKSVAMVAALKKAGATNVEFTVYPEQKHGIMELTYKKKELYDWFAKQTLTVVPGP